MKFLEEKPGQGMVRKSWSSSDGRLEIAWLNFAFGQHRIQIWDHGHRWRRYGLPEVVPPNF